MHKKKRSCGFYRRKKEDSFQFFFLFFKLFGTCAKKGIDSRNIGTVCLLILIIYDFLLLNSV